MKIGCFKLLFIFLAIFPCIYGNAQNTFYIYNEGFVNGLPTGTMGAKDAKGLKIDSNSTENPFKGKYALKISADSTEAWSGLYIQSAGKWKSGQGTYANLNPYKYLVFNIRSNTPTTVAKLGMGEDGKESTTTEKGIKVNYEWKRVIFEVPENRDNINGLFLIVFEGGAQVFLDEIYYADSNLEFLPFDEIYKAPAKALSPDAYYVYSDFFNNGIPSGYNGEKNGISIKVNPDWRINPYYGSKCMKIDVVPTESWRGFYIFSSGSWEPSDNQREKCPDLSAYDVLTFYAKADRKHTFIRELGMGELGRDNSEGARSIVYLELTTEWKKYEIRLDDLDKSRVNKLLFMILDIGTIYFDEVKYIKSNEK